MKDTNFVNESITMLQNDLMLAINALSSFMEVQEFLDDYDDAHFLDEDMFNIEVALRHFGNTTCSMLDTAEDIKRGRIKPEDLKF